MPQGSRSTAAQHDPRQEEQHYPYVEAESHQGCHRIERAGNVNGARAAGDKNAERVSFLFFGGPSLSVDLPCVHWLGRCGCVSLWLQST